MKAGFAIGGSGQVNVLFVKKGASSFSFQKQAESWSGGVRAPRRLSGDWRWLIAHEQPDDAGSARIEKILGEKLESSMNRIVVLASLV